MAKNDSTPPAEPPTKAERDAAIERAIADLSPEEARLFNEALALSIQKRRLLMTGYITAALCVFLGGLWALYLYGQTDSDAGSIYDYWVFLLPFASAGASLMIFGRLARRVGG